jgi:hypothetical protein
MTDFYEISKNSVRITRAIADVEHKKTPPGWLGGVDIGCVCKLGLPAD